MAEGGGSGSEERAEISLIRDLREFDLSDLKEEGNSIVERVLGDLSKVKTQMLKV